MVDFSEMRAGLLGVNGANNEIHKPTAFNPQDYEAIGWFDIQAASMAPDDKAEATAMRKLLADSPTSVYNKGQRASQCDHCGAHIRYVGVILHKPTNTHMAMGEDCMKRLEIENKAAFRLQFIRDHAHNMAQHAKRMAAYNEFMGKHPELVEVFAAAKQEDKDGLLPTGYGPATIRDIEGKLVQWGSISDRQVELCLKLHEEQKQRVVMLAQRQAEEATMDDAPEGRMEVTGKVVSTKMVEGDWGTTYKMLLVVEQPKRFKLWVTQPAGLDVQRGDIVTLTCTIQPSQDDKKFAFGSRPSKSSKQEAKQ